MKGTRHTRKERRLPEQPVRWTELSLDHCAPLPPSADRDPAPLASAQSVLASAPDEVEITWAMGSNRTYDLRAGGAVLARYRFVGKAQSGYLPAIVETADGQWTLTIRSRLTSLRLTAVPATRPGGPPEVEVRRDLQHHWDVQISEGPSMRWQSDGLASTDWVLMNHDVVLARMIAEWDQIARVELAPGSGDLPRLLLILTIGWHLLLLYRSAPPGE